MSNISSQSASDHYPSDLDHNLNKRRSHGTTSATLTSHEDNDSGGDVPASRGAINKEDETEITIDQRPLLLVVLMMMLTVCAKSLNKLAMNQFMVQFSAKVIFGNVSVDKSRCFLGCFIFFRSFVVVAIHVCSLL